MIKLYLSTWDQCMDQKLINGWYYEITEPSNLIDDIAGSDCYG